MSSIIDLYYLPEEFVKLAQAEGLRVGHNFDLYDRPMLVKYIGTKSRIMPEGPVVAIGVVEVIPDV